MFRHAFPAMAGGSEKINSMGSVLQARTIPGFIAALRQIATEYAHTIFTHSQNATGFSSFFGMTTGLTGCLRPVSSEKLKSFYN
jgi:hypothetical protein